MAAEDSVAVTPSANATFKIKYLATIYRFWSVALPVSRNR